MFRPDSEKPDKAIRRDAIKRLYAAGLGLGAYLLSGCLPSARDQHPLRPSTNHYRGSFGDLTIAYWGDIRTGELSLKTDPGALLNMTTPQRLSITVAQENLRIAASLSPNGPKDLRAACYLELPREPVR